MKPTVFFDGGCPLCRREIQHYRRLDLGERVRWVDITAAGEVLARHGIDPAAAMQRLHALNERGEVVTGVAAFLVVWRQLPGYRHLARLLERLGLTPVLDRAYARFAVWRLRRRCAGGVCRPAGSLAGQPTSQPVSQLGPR